MSEQPPERESDPTLISSIRRYYFDVQFTVDTETSAIMAMSRLTDSLPPDANIGIDAIFRSGGMPLDWEYDFDLRVTKEKLAILPLLAIGPILDGSSISPSDLKSWYSDAVLGVKALVSGEHTVQCLTCETDWHQMCDSSAECPIIITKKYLTQDAATPDFSDPMYVSDFKRGFEIATSKLTICAEHRLLDMDARKILLEDYKKKYIRYTVPLQINNQE